MPILKDIYWMTWIWRLASLRPMSPIVAIATWHGKMIAKAYDQSYGKRDPTAHAEMLVIQQSCQKYQTRYLQHATIYCIMEPCPMCFGAMLQARIQKLVFSNYNPRLGVCGGNVDLLQTGIANYHSMMVIGGVLRQKTQPLLQNYFSTYVR